MVVHSDEILVLQNKLSFTPEDHDIFLCFKYLDLKQLTRTNYKRG